MAINTDKLLADVQELLNLLKHGRPDQLEEVQSWYDGVRKNLFTQNLLQHEGFKILRAHLDEYLRSAVGRVYDRTLYFKDRPAYLTQLDRAWREIDSVVNVYGLLIGPEAALKEYQRVINEQLEWLRNQGYAARESEPSPASV